jgi:hypothetical protein
MPGRSPRVTVVVGVAAALSVVVLVAGGVAVWWLGRAPAGLTAGDVASTARPPGAASPATGVEAAAPAEPPGDARHAEAEGPAAAAMDGEDAFDARALAWSAVDLDAVRKALPDNIYWTMSAPTKDPAVREWREQERERWNVEYGKVLSNTATAEEIDAYYARRKRIAEDYVAFAGHLLLYYRDRLPAQDVGLLKLAMDMNLARLEEIPRQIAEAQERREAHDAVRRKWLEEQAAFAAPRRDTPRE